MANVQYLAHSTCIHCALILGQLPNGTWVHAEGLQSELSYCGPGTDTRADTA
jgi:hypothetical protein